MACLISHPRSASARQIEEAVADGGVALAEQKAAQAFDAYQGKRFAEAVALYTQAYEAAPNGDILYNIARIYDVKLGDRPLAINFYRRYIADPGANATRIQLANERLVALREAELAASEPVSIPGAPAAAASVAAEPGASAAGWTGAEWTGAVLAATGVVGIGIGTGFGIAAMDETHTSRDLCDGGLCREQRGIDAAEAATDHALVSTIAFASGGALLALGAAFYFWGGGEPSEKPAQAWNGGVELDGRLSQNHGGWSLELTGTW